MRLLPIFTVLSLILAACAPAPAPTAPKEELPWQYHPRTETGPRGEPITVPTVKLKYLTERNKRQLVQYTGPDRPGTIVVDPYARVLYHVLNDGQAMRFGIAVGEAGKNFKGDAVIMRKADWPSWTPTANMIRNNPELYGPLRNGLKGGLDNPLGARALYLYRNGRDTMYRIHGTMDPSSVGKATSAGCIRLFNQDVMDLFDEIPNGTRVHVRSQSESLAIEGRMIETPEGYLLPQNEAAAFADLGQSATTTSASPVESAIPAR